jgi:hypothetical protein
MEAARFYEKPDTSGVPECLYQWHRHSKSHPILTILSDSIVPLR